VQQVLDRTVTAVTIGKGRMYMKNERGERFVTVQAQLPVRQA
jgi:hypothetical protein